MIFLDTNVVSGLIHREPDPRLIAWMDRQPRSLLCTTAVTVFEVRAGLEALPAGRRRRGLHAAFDQVLSAVLAGGVAALDKQAAEIAARLMARRAARGRTIEFRDTLIAGIAIAHGATFATHNTRHFADLEIEVLDPLANPPT